MCWQEKGNFPGTYVEFIGRKRMSPPMPKPRPPRPPSAASARGDSESEGEFQTMLSRIFEFLWVLLQSCQHGRTWSDPYGPVRICRQVLLICDQLMFRTSPSSLCLNGFPSLRGTVRNVSPLKVVFSKFTKWACCRGDKTAVTTTQLRPRSCSRRNCCNCTVSPNYQLPAIDLVLMKKSDKQKSIFCLFQCW